jgi:hypothetical protein
MEEDRKAERHAFQNTFWEPVAIKPIPNLAELRQLVITHFEDIHSDHFRSPKWKFWIAQDLVIELQGKLTTQLLKFDGTAVVCMDADSRLFTAPREVQREYWSMKFRLTAKVPDEWLLKPTSVGHHLAPEQRRAAGPWRGAQIEDSATGTAIAIKAPDDSKYQMWMALRTRVIEELEHYFDGLQPVTMLSSNCTICGKALTDPVSMARFIGPECAGTGSPRLPFVCKLFEREIEQSPLQIANL